jgi:MraZ protein
MFMAGVKVIETDSTDRVQIPKDLIKHSGISKEIVLSSAVNRVEIWDKTKYEEVISDPEVDFAQLAEDVMGNQNAKDE